MIDHMNARQVFRFRDDQGDVTVEIVIWALSKPTPDRLHGLKYRLYCGKDGRCIVRYDNETGKGDHRHYGRREEAYVFESVENYSRISNSIVNDWLDGYGNEPNRD